MSSPTKIGPRRRVVDPNIANPNKLHQVAKPKTAGEKSPRPPSSTISKNIYSFWGEEPKKGLDNFSRTTTPLDRTGTAAAIDASSKPGWVQEQERSSIKEWYASNNKISSSDAAPFKKRKILFETQQIMPAPGTTYFQLVIQEDRVLLRDWPRQRYSQKWTRDGGLNPGEKIIETESFIRGDMEAELVYIFGQDVYDKAIEAAQESLNN